MTATFAVGGSESMVLDPIDSTASLDVTFGRNAAGKRVVFVVAVVRAYRLDRPNEHPTTLAIRATVPDGGTQPTSSRDTEAYFTTWPTIGGGASVGRGGARSYATLARVALTYSITSDAIEVRGALTLRDVPTGRWVALDRLVIRKVGEAVLPSRTGAFRAAEMPRN